MNDEDPKTNADKLRAAWPVTAQTLRDLETLAADMPAGDAAVFVTDAELDSRNRLGATFNDEQCQALRNINIESLKNAPLVSMSPPHRSPFTRAWDALRRFVARLVRRP